MAATSVTGTGPGESFGKQKPENNAGCGGDPVEEVKKKIFKPGCHISYKTRGNASFKAGGSKSIHVC